MRLRSIEGPTAFTLEGSYLLAVDGGILHAYDLIDRRWIDLAQVGTTPGALLTTGV